MIRKNEKFDLRLWTVRELQNGEEFKTTHIM